MEPNTPKRRAAHGLPSDVTSFVGRRHEIAEVKALLAKSRLVTLTGFGGVGKTRLASRTAMEVQRAFADGVWFVDLSAMSDPGMLAPALMEVLEVEEQSNRQPIEPVAEYLADKKGLLILDNCEHLLQDCAILAELLLAGADGLRIIATSREPLRIAGERTMVVHPLPVPDSAADLSPQALAEVDAVRLFLERAEAVVPGFAITEANRDAVEQICRRLDGIPLAIELAAVRLRALSVHQLVDRLEDRFKMLTTGSRTATRRQQTLRALVDWSYALCTAPQRLLWARASVFHGGLDLSAAEAVCAGDGIAAEDVLDLISGLVEKSVLVREEHEGQVRYRLLDTVREYGLDRLAESGGQQEMRRRHREFYRGLARLAGGPALGGEQALLLRRLRLDHANLRAALRSALEEGDPEDGLRMAVDLLYHWRMSNQIREGRRWLQAGLARVTGPCETRGWALAGASWLAIMMGDVPAAVAMTDEARRLGERLRLGHLLAYVALYAGMACVHQDEIPTAVKLYEEALAAHRAAGDERGEVVTLTRLCMTYDRYGDPRRGVAAGEEAVRICDARGEGWHRSYAVMALGVVAWRQGEITRATALEKETLRHTSALGDRAGMGIAMEVLAWISASKGDPERAATLLGALRTLWRRAEAPLMQYGNLVRYHEQCEARIRDCLGEPAFLAALEQGARLSFDEALAYAMEERTPDGRAPKALEAARASPLTRRETEIAGLVAEGLSNKAIAARLVIAQRTAEGHIEHILSKLGFHSRAQIAVWVAEQDRLGVS
ncbi:LuxR family transcriptional regulator [Sphaerisporangium melleum]|uniref:LuxR family transcriptional regulator n=1 Tax=Sphaerisporangium melleum TaxID=321316 RepID=A0A917R0K1_9ACTN|nr:LuxR C-terminal-related transcriptional regulator [Sphaerisporangium melleum]GGK79711.1 LuxR family transcriptional regulator [Sphaerisporangium melleum]GII69669.1 LuxR family transcriptional regulator [Sphaerisporangium melleum]